MLHVAPTRPDPTDEPGRTTAHGTLAGLLARLTDAAPAAPFLADDPGREAASGRPPGRWSRAAALTAIDRLAARLARLQLDPGSIVAIQLPNASEACLALLAVETAGLTPCLVPASFDEGELDDLLGRTKARAVMTQTRLGPLRPAEAACRVAMRRFQLRFILAFGPDVPAGVIDLDAVLTDDAVVHVNVRLSPEMGGAHRGSHGVLITAETGPDGARAISRSGPALLAGAVGPIRAMRLGPGDTVLNLLAQDDLKGLCTGLVACLLTGASLRLAEGPEALRQVASADGPTHLVLPGWAGELARMAGLPASLRSLVLVQDAAAWPGSSEMSCRSAVETVEVVALGERAILTARCDRDDANRDAVDLFTRLAGRGGEFLDVQLSDEGEIHLRGLAADAVVLGSGGNSETGSWLRSGYRWTQPGRFEPTS